VAHDQTRPSRPATACLRVASVPRPVELRPDRRQHDRQQRHGHRDADQRDQQPGGANAPHERHRQSEQREQRDRHGGAAEDDGGTSVAHRVPDSHLVRDVRTLPLFPPPHDDKQRVIDRDAETDQGDEELDDHRDVGDARQRPDEKEGRRDRDERHQQRHEGHERPEDEGEDDQGA
jgi:hypothetical protein